MHYLVAALMLLGSMLVGCASDEWIHRYKKQEEFVYDYNKCDRQAETMANSGARSVSITPYMRTSLIDQCLMKEGWMKKKKQ
jgi:hypothetical protein